MRSLRKIIIRSILVIFVLSTVGVVVLYLFTPIVTPVDTNNTTGSTTADMVADIDEIQDSDI